MTHEEEHRGSLFLGLPDGEALIYPLVGVAGPPQPSAAISKTATAKTPLVIPLPVKNWLQQPQRFKVIIEIEAPKDPTTSLTGLNYIDVPPLLEREFKLDFLAHKEGATNAKIIFKNDATKEYIFYQLHVTCGPPQVMQVIQLETPVRQAVSHTFHIDNPLSAEAAFTASCTCPDVTFSENFTIPPM